MGLWRDKGRSWWAYGGSLLFKEGFLSALIGYIGFFSVGILFLWRFCACGFSLFVGFLSVIFLNLGFLGECSGIFSIRIKMLTLHLRKIYKTPKYILVKETQSSQHFVPYCSYKKYAIGILLKQLAWNQMIDTEQLLHKRLNFITYGIYLRGNFLSYNFLGKGIRILHFA